MSVVVDPKPYACQKVSCGVFFRKFGKFFCFNQILIFLLDLIAQLFSTFGHIDIQPYVCVKLTVQND